MRVNGTSLRSSSAAKWIHREDIGATLDFREFGFGRHMNGW